MATAAEQLAQAQAEELARYRAEEKARREAAEKARQDEERSGWFNKFTSLFTDFSFSSLIMWALVAFAAYSIAKTDWGQDLIQKVVSNFEPDTQAMITGMFNKFGIDVDMDQSLSGMTQAQFKTFLTERAETSAEMATVLSENREASSKRCAKRT